MSEASISCPKCQTSMEKGFIPDHAQAVAFQPAWYKGEPEEKTFLGLPGGIKTKRTSFGYDNKPYPLIAYRCPQCALVELYAPAV